MAKTKPSLRQRIANFLSRKSQTPVVTVEDWLKGVTNSEITTSDPMNLSGVYACINIISNTVSKLPFFVINRHTKEHIDLPDIYELLNVQPNGYMNAVDFKQLIATSMLTGGNGYIYPVRNRLRIKALRYLPEEAVSIYHKNGETVYEFTLDEVKHRESFDDLIHLKQFTLDGVMGVSPLTYARLTTRVGLNQEEFQKAFYENGGRPSGVLRTDTDLSSKEFERTDENGNKYITTYKNELLKEWHKVQMGTGNAYKTAVLDFGLHYETVPQISPADMDFVNSKTVNLEDIARFFNVPPYKLGVGKQTYSNNEQAQIDYITNCIVPFVSKWEQEFTAKLLTVEQRRMGYQIKANIEAELRGDTSSRANWYDKMRSMGVYSINEIRNLENLPNIEYGDARLIGANSVPLERLLAGDTAGTATPNDLNPDNEESIDDDEQ